VVSTDYRIAGDIERILTIENILNVQYKFMGRFFPFNFKAIRKTIERESLMSTLITFASSYTASLLWILLPQE